MSKQPICHLAYNTVTGLFWNGKGFTAPEWAAAALDAVELAVLRVTYLNVGVINIGRRY